MVRAEHSLRSDVTDSETAAHWPVRGRVSKTAVAQPARLDRLSLLRPVYVSLINTGRAYAAFDAAQLRESVTDLADRGEILDPMSGYGRLMEFGAKEGVPTYSLEYVAPLHLWQRLVHPCTSALLGAVVEELLSVEDEWPRASAQAEAWDGWLPTASESLILRLLALCARAIETLSPGQVDTTDLAVATLLPFLGRLMTWVPGEGTRVTKGGICVYRNWEGDLRQYLLALLCRLEHVMCGAKPSKHNVVLSDCRSYSFEANRFGAMITSPPYPNHQSFTSMFAPEIHLLRWLGAKGLLTLPVTERPAIGGIGVKGRAPTVVRSKVARRFLKNLLEWKGNKKAMRANRTYYCRYFEAYFGDLERAFENISASLRHDFAGHIVVVDNTSRNQIVPLSDFVVETWRRLGFQAEAHMLREKFHVGTKNPSARGLKAKHAEYLVTVARR